MYSTVLFCMVLDACGKALLLLRGWMDGERGELPLYEGYLVQNNGVECVGTTSTPRSLPLAAPRLAMIHQARRTILLMLCAAVLQSALLTRRDKDRGSSYQCLWSGAERSEAKQWKSGEWRECCRKSRQCSG